MRKNYDKLIRDRIPEIMDAQGVTYQVRVMTDAEYQAALREKIVEEANEVVQASPVEITKELADLQEVMDALMVAVGVTPEEVRAMQIERRDERGGFSERLKLLWTE
ncbi:MAG: nucleoside triphosphate pyrophosphohydrolase [Trueperaceae bacterium]|nr:nucleoside triphosphate pyrophosphohydrolase [Trueperaceae bacterium]